MRILWTGKRHTNTLKTERKPMNTERQAWRIWSKKKHNTFPRPKQEPKRGKAVLDADEGRLYFKSQSPAKSTGFSV